MENRTLVFFALLALLINCSSLVSARPISLFPSSGLAEPAPGNGTTNATGCAAKTNCGDCSDSYDCVWCDSNNVCYDGSFYGPNGGNAGKWDPLNECKDWRWKQCKVNGRIVFWSAVAIVAAGLMLFSLTFCLCCYCYCKRSQRRRIISKQKTWEEIKKEEAEMQGLRSKTPVTDSRRQQLYEKYGRPDDRSLNAERSTDSRGSGRKSIFA